MKADVGWVYDFISSVNQGDRIGWVQNFLAWPQGWKDSPQIFYKLLTNGECALEMECGDVVSEYNL